MKVKIAFYKAQKNKFVDWAIAGWTWFRNKMTLNTSHVELGFFLNNEWKYFSSTLRGKSKGVRWISEKNIFKHPERWEVLEVEKSEEEIATMVRNASNYLGAKYDLWGILGFVLPFGFNSVKKWYCSEICWLILTDSWEKRISPRLMWKKAIYELGAKKCLTEL